jgi:hypothetical protein
MFSFFKRTPVLHDKAFEELAEMLWMDDEQPTHRRELLNPSVLDFSVHSLAHVDDYLDAIRGDGIGGEVMMRVVLRAGAYVGEVVRRHSKTEYHWVDYAQAASESSMVKDVGMYLGTMGVLRASPDTMCFPLGKVCKFLEAGREDSVQFFARTIIEGLARPA